MYETQSQFGKVEGGRLSESLLYECVIFPGYLFTIMTSHVGVVTPTNTAMPKLPYSGKIWRAKNLANCSRSRTKI